jgi:hypothetical protein
MDHLAPGWAAAFLNRRPWLRQFMARIACSDAPANDIEEQQYQQQHHQQQTQNTAGAVAPPARVRLSWESAHQQQDKKDQSARSIPWYPPIDGRENGNRGPHGNRPWPCASWNYYPALAAWVDFFLRIRTGFKMRTGVARRSW